MHIIKREISEELLDMSTRYPVVTILGPRQSGKTTIAKQLFPNKPYISLENLDESALAQSDPRGFLARFPQGAVLDEIQRQPQLLSYIQGIVDERDLTGMFILTGSHQLDLVGSISQSLAGRTAILKLLPLTISELSRENINLSLEEYILHGMYPRLYKSHINPTKFYKDYIQTYIERDVRQIINIKDLHQFQQFLKLCAGRVGQIFNSSNLSNELGVSAKTIKSWLSVLEASFLIFMLQPYYENFGKRVTKAPKLYFTDVGLATCLLEISSVEQLHRDPLRGGLVENLVILECIKTRLNQGLEQDFYYYKDSNNNEIDVLFRAGSSLIPIEIKSSQTFNMEFIKNIKHFKSIAKERCPLEFLVYSGNQEQNIGSCHIINYKNTSQIFRIVDSAY